MFHKQNIPPSAPAKEDNDAQDTTTQTEAQDNTAESQSPATETSTQQETTTMTQSTPPFARPTLGGTQGTTYGTAQTTTQADNRRLTIGEGITMSGEIDNCDQLLVEGTVEATLNGSKLLEIAESGVFYGSVDIEEAIIAGRFEGDLTVDGRVTIESTGTVTGTITYRELTVEAGATIEGKIASFASSASSKGEQGATDFSKLKAASKKTDKKANAA